MRRGLMGLVGLLLVPACSVPVPARVVPYEVRSWSSATDLEAFAAEAAETLADDRGWSLGGTVAFRRVEAGGQFTLWLSAPDGVPGFAPGGCTAAWSCRVGRNVVINERRWIEGSPAWDAAGGTRRDYRHMVVNHEVGHWLGLSHTGCGGPGQMAPVMHQQSQDLGGCTPNAWPLAGERDRVAGSSGVEVNHGHPFGRLDVVTAAAGATRVAGWAIDPDTPAPVVVHVHVDGVAAVAVAADRDRPDVGAAHAAYGSHHGFDVVVPAPGQPPGAEGPAPQHELCAYALNRAEAGDNALLGCGRA